MGMCDGHVMGMLWACVMTHSGPDDVTRAWPHTNPNPNPNQNPNPNPDSNLPPPLALTLLRWPGCVPHLGAAACRVGGWLS